MGLLKILRKTKQKEKETRILLLGLDNAGKTTILKRFKGVPIDTISPTLGFSIESLEFRGLGYQVFTLKTGVRIPVGDAFRTRLRMFPSLINSCTIDWFHEWPAEALYSVAKQKMESFLENSMEVTGDAMEGVLTQFRNIHQGVEVLSKDFLERTQRRVYITPTSYLELLGAYESIVKEVKSAKDQVKKRYANGLDKIMDAESQVADLQQDLTVKKPILEKTQVEVQELIVKIDKDKADAAEVQAVCQVQEEGANAKAAECKAIADD
eukprot:gene361-553_t